MTATLKTEVAIARQKLRDIEDLLARLQAAIPSEPETKPATGLLGLQNPEAFWDGIRGEAGELFPKISQAQVDGVQALLDIGAGYLPASWCAYVLATAYHETNLTMQPVKEAYWCSENWRKTHLRYYPWYGRGLVQLTWKENYQLASGKLQAAGYEHWDCVTNPDNALRLDNAVFIIATGMIEGWFTHKKLNDYIPAAASKEHFRAARKIINGTDKDELIAGYAVQFYEALKKGEWK